MREEETERSGGTTERSPLGGARLAELNAMLDLNKKDNEIVDDDREDEEPSEPARSDLDCQ